MTTRPELDGKQLASMAELFASGKLRAFVKADLPLEDADRAYAGPIPGNPGNVVIRIM